MFDQKKKKLLPITKPTSGKLVKKKNFQKVKQKSYYGKEKRNRVNFRFTKGFYVKEGEPTTAILTWELEGWNDNTTLVRVQPCGRKICPN